MTEIDIRFFKDKRAFHSLLSLNILARIQLSNVVEEIIRVQDIFHGRFYHVKCFFISDFVNTI